MASTNSSAHLFTPVAHPELRRLGRKPIFNFLRERERYLLRIADANASGSSVNAVSLKSSIDPHLLLSLVEFGEFGDSKTPAILTDDEIEEWLETKAEVDFKSVPVDEMTAAVKRSVRMNLDEQDPQLRAISLFTDYKNFLRNKRWDGIIDSNPKLAISHICGCLVPTVLQEKVSSDLAYDRTLAKSWIPFYRHVLQRTVACEEFFPAKAVKSATVAKQNDKQAPETRPPSRNNVKKTVKTEAILRPSTEDSGNQGTKISNAREVSSSSGATAPRTVREMPFCLNKLKCPGSRHYIKDCPESTEEEKKKLLEEHRASKEKSKGLRALAISEPYVNAEPVDRPSGMSGRYSATLADKVEVVLNGDYGSDHCALSEKHLAKCAAAGIFVSVLPLDTPISMAVALNGNDTEQLKFQSKRKARISTTLNLPTGPLRLRNVEYLVFEEDMDEVLLSRPLLQSIGFNLDDHLASVREVFHDTDFSHVGFSSTIMPQQSTLPKKPSHLSRILLTPNVQEEAVLSLDEEVTTEEINPLINCEAQSDGEKDDGTVPSQLFYGDVDLEDDNITFKDVEIGVDDAEQTAICLESMIKEAIEHGLPIEYHEELRTLVYSYSDIFRTKLGADPPADTPAMKIRLKPDAIPVRVKVRRYSPPQAKFLREKTDELLGLGLIFPNNQSEWASAPLIVPKKGGEGYRFTVDMRPVNKQTVQHVWPMPNLESVTSQLQGAQCFSVFDFCNGYWQLALDKESQECQSFVTPDGVFTPTRVMQGQTNAVSFFQSSLQGIFVSIREKMLQWIDDMLMHCKSIRELMDTIAQLFALCRSARLKLHAAKCHLFLLVVKWCGRLISKDGIRFDPSRLDALIGMHAPRTGDELQQFVCAANWMRTAIPQFTTTMEPLSAALEAVYTEAGSRKRRAVSKVKLTSNHWGPTQQNAFSSIKDALKNCVTLGHPDPAKVLCLFTDASDTHWSGVLTQIPQSDVDLPFEEQRHDPLSFLSGSFKGSRCRWSTPEKEAFAIVESVTRLDYLVLRPGGFLMFTDHKNLTFLYNPVTVQPQMPRHVLTKVQRWAMRLSQFEYSIIHIPGVENCWADLLSRWGASDPDNTQSSPRIAALLKAPVAPDLQPDFEWPTEKEIHDVQHAAIAKGNEEAPSATRRSLRVTDGAVWIPKYAVSLQLRICVIAHCGRGGHRGLAATFENIRPHFFWKNMRTDITTFCNTCLHCLSTCGGDRVPRAMGHALHAEKPNELIHFDFLYMGPGDGDFSYILIIKDDASSFVWLEAVEAADAKTAASTLLKWFSLFGVVMTWNSDQGSHFKNSVMRSLNRELHAQHNFTTPYCPQSNGTVEIVCKEVLRAFRALLSEFRMKSREWPTLTGLVQSILNHSKRPSLGNRAPITAFTGQPADSPLRTLLSPDSRSTRSIAAAKAAQLIHIESVHKALDSMHRDIAQRRSRRREEAISVHNAKTHIKPINFDVGDFVLVAKRSTCHGKKLRLKWTGPRRIIRVVSDFIFEVEDLITGSYALIHSNRLKFYADSQLNVTEELLDTVEHNDPHLQTVTKLLDMRFNDHFERFEVQAKWRGFDEEEPTWEPFANLKEDIPDMLEKFLKKFPDQAMVRRARSS